MASSKPVVVIFGAGPNVGAALISKFQGAGYRVAAVSRSAPEDAAPDPSCDLVKIHADLAEASQVPGVFDVIRRTWNTFPQVAIWNAASFSPCPEAGNMFSVALASVEYDLSLMVKSSLVAAGECFRAWTAAKGGEDEEGQRTFIMTGNILPKVVLPFGDYMTSGVAKMGAAYWIQAADVMYKDKGMRFFYAEERTAEGDPIGNAVARSHADMFLHLAEGNHGLPSWISFTNGEYRRFE